MQKVSPKIEILIISIGSPLQIGIYQEGKLIEKVCSEQKTSEVLLKLLMELLDRYECASIFYTNGPGSYMAIKLTYITLRTLEMIKQIPFYGCDAFSLNKGNPIKAMGKLYFIKEKETIITKKFDEAVEQRFDLPSMLSEVILLDDNKPLYILPAT